MEPLLQQMAEHGYDRLTAAIHKIWDGERDQATLTRGADAEDTKIIQTILRGIDDPEILKALR